MSQTDKISYQIVYYNDYQRASLYGIKNNTSKLDLSNYST